jgi:hypothetical protein
MLQPLAKKDFLAKKRKTFGQSFFSTAREPFSTESGGLRTKQIIACCVIGAALPDFTLRAVQIPIADESGPGSWQVCF